MPVKHQELHLVQELAEDFFERAGLYYSDKEALDGHLSQLLHKVVRVSRVRLPEGNPEYRESIVFTKRPREQDWLSGEYSNAYNVLYYDESQGDAVYRPLVGIVFDYEIVEGDEPVVYIAVVVPNDDFSYRFNLRYSHLEVLDGFPAEG